MATATPYISGIKKPLNAIENPVFPDIKKAPPRFVWSRKHWQVDPGAVLRDTEPYVQFIEPAILAQSRDYNKTVYGQSSHKEIVNANFRPPLIRQYEDLEPLTRIPAKVNPVLPHINPGTAGHDGGTSGYTAKNQRSNDIESALTDRIKSGEMRPTFYAPMDVPIDNSVLPDLEAKLPPISVHSGWQFPSYNTQEHPEIDLGEEKIEALPIQTGFTPSFTIDGPHGFENYQAHENRPTYSATAGMNNPFEFNAPNSSESLELYRNLPETSVDAGMNTPYQFNGEMPEIELFDNRPQVSVSAGMNTPIEIDGEQYSPELYYNRPQYSADAGMNTPIEINAEAPDIELYEKLGETPIYVINPGSEEGYKTEIDMHADEVQFIQENRPNFSYVIPSEEPLFRTRNVETQKPHFREKLQPVKSYGQVSQSSGAIPRAGIEMFRETLKETAGRRTRPNKYEVKKKKSVYRF